MINYFWRGDYPGLSVGCSKYNYLCTFKRETKGDLTEDKKKRDNVTTATETGVIYHKPRDAGPHHKLGQAKC